jgi:RNA polymerase sigma-70 factor (ECF subfamily)
MSAPRATEDLAVFESHRPAMLGLAYRMLGDVGRAQDIVQEAWLRWHQRDVEVDSPKAFLVTVVTRLCLNELTSARARREESRSDRLPEPVDLDQGGMARLEEREQLSMAILVVLERLTPAERATLLLHDVFDFAHEEIATLVARTPAACRKLLERARHKVAAGRRLISASREEHQQLLDAFVRAASAGDVAGLVGLLATDAVMITDGGPEGRVFAGRWRVRSTSPRSWWPRRVGPCSRSNRGSSTASRRWSSTGTGAHSRPSCWPWPTARSSASSSMPT